MTIQDDNSTSMYVVYLVVGRWISASLNLKTLPTKKEREREKENERKLFLNTWFVRHGKFLISFDGSIHASIKAKRAFISSVKYETWLSR